MKQILMMLFLLMLPFSSYQLNSNFSNICKKCVSVPCPIKVGLLAGLTVAEESAVIQALSVINSKTSLHPNWEIRLTLLGRDNRNLLRDWNKQKLFSILTDQLLSSNLSVVIGPESSVVVEWIHPLLVMLNITHIVPLASNPTFLDPGRFPNLIRMVPADSYQIKAVVSLLEYFRHTQLSLLTTDDEYGLSMVESFRRHSYQTKEFRLRKVIMLRVPTNRSNIHYNLIQIIKCKPHLVVLATDYWIGRKILTEAYQSNMTTLRGWLWIAMDAMTSVPVENVWMNGKPSLFFGEQLGLRSQLVTHKIHEQLNLTHQTNISFTVERYIDSFLLVADRIKQTCKGSKEIKAGDSLSIPYFDHHRTTRPVIYDVLRSNESDWSKIGQWSSNTQSSVSQLTMATSSYRPSNRLKVTTHFEPQFVYFENSNETDPSKLQGYCIDMLKELSRLADFEYDIHLVKDGLWGVINKSGQWDGMIGEVMRGEADFAVSAITLTEERAQVVDFLPPFEKLELKFLVKRSFKSKDEYNPFAFFDPFDISLYRAILISVVSLAVFVSFLSIVSPYGIRGSFFQTKLSDAAKRAAARTKSVGLFIPKKTKKEKRLLKKRDDAERGMGLNNSLYLFWAALFCQAPERLPRSISAKVVAITWYMAATVFVSSYTANLVTSVSRFTQEVDFIRSTEDLLMQNVIQFGADRGHAVESELRSSKLNLVKKLYDAIQSDRSWMGHWVTNESKAYDLVSAGKFAFIGESLVLDLKAVSSKCDLKTVSLGFGSLKYAIAIQKSFPYYNLLSEHMQAMKENGFLQMLLEKYFPEMDACSHFDVTRPRSRQLTFADLAGVFIVLGGMMAVGFIFLGIEWIVAAFADMKALKPHAPKTVREALRIRRNRVSMDIHANWFPFEQVVKKWEKPLLPAQDIAEQIEKWIQLRKSANLIELSLRRQFSPELEQAMEELDRDWSPIRSSATKKANKSV